MMDSKRRSVVLGVAAAVVGSLGRTGGSSAVAASARPHRIDVHSHIAPPEWIRRLTPEGLILPPMANWTIA
jgi:hypothetical protein